jgi:hypothetical protein
LLGPDGRAVSSVSVQALAQGGAAQVNAYGAGEPRWWPPLLPDPYLHCVLTGGPGPVTEHLFLEPGAAVPDHLVVRGLVYRASRHCGHRDCPRHYHAAEHTG